MLQRLLTLTDSLGVQRPDLDISQRQSLAEVALRAQLAPAPGPAPALDPFPAPAPAPRRMDAPPVAGGRGYYGANFDRQHGQQQGQHGPRGGRGYGSKKKYEIFEGDSAPSGDEVVRDGYLFRQQAGRLSS